MVYRLYSHSHVLNILFVLICKYYLNDFLLKLINDRYQVVNSHTKAFYKCHKDLLKVDVATGQGGTFDYEAGRIKRAPKLMQKIGLEWVWRLMKQPSRIERMRVLPIYLIKIILKKDKTKGRFG